MLRRFFPGIAAIAAALFLFVLPAAAQQRLALVIGNAAYPKGPLQISLADGGLVAEALTSIGFDVTEGADTNGADMRRLFGEFVEKVTAAGPDTIAFIYYNGYALQFEGDNYLIPVDAQLNRDSEIPIQGIRLFDVLRPLADSPAMTKIVVLDAARPLPFQIQGGEISVGLGAIESSPGMLVAFSSAPGTVAQDGPGPYGAYATAIAEMVREPGLDIDTLFARIRLRTNEATQGAQIPWEVSQLQQVAMLVPGEAAAPPAGMPQGLVSAPQTQIGAPVVRRRPPPRPIRDIGPEEAYGYVVEQDELPAYEEYVRAYPSGAYTPRVWAIIRARREALVWRRALLVNSPDGYWTYLDRYPDGMYVFDARRRLRRLAAGDRPPPGWRMMVFDDAPPPMPGEPSRMISVYPPAPPPPRFLRPPPAFIVGLPPPGRRDGGGLLRNPQRTFPVIVQPQGGQRPGAIGGRPGPGGPGAVGVGIQPGAVGVGGQPPIGQKGPPPGVKGAPGVGLPGQIPQTQKGPAVVNQPPVGSPPVVNQPPVGVGVGGGAPKGPPGGFKGPQGGQPGGFKGQQGQQGGFKGPQGGQPKVMTQPSGPPQGQPKVGVGAPQTQPMQKGPPPQMQKGPPPQQMKQMPPPTVRAVPPPQPPKVAPPPPPKAAPPPPPKAPPPPPQVKGPPPGAKGLPKCATVGGKQPCAP